MSVLRFFAVVLIFACVSIAWMILGGAVWFRTESLSSDLGGEMVQLLGPTTVRQVAPYVTDKPAQARGQDGTRDVDSSDIAVDISHEQRNKGLLWFSTFTAAFDATYGVSCDKPAWLIFEMPSGITRVDAMEALVDGQPAPVSGAEKISGHMAIELAAVGAHKVTLRYKTMGQNNWEYAPGPARASAGGLREACTSTAMSELRRFSLAVTTDFKEIDYPKGSSSPSQRAVEAGPGMKAQWQYASSMTRQSMGVVMPKRPDAGPIVHRMSLFAPVSLFFFFTVLFTVIVLKKIELHPMHYLFIAAAFFAFHLLLAYLCDQVNIHAAFWISAAVSVVLVVSYMRLTAGVKFAVTYVALAQLVYLVGFSYAFFYPGQTGLTITIGAILTLFVLMQATGRVKWSQVFTRRGQGAAVPPLPPVLRPA